MRTYSACVPSMVFPRIQPPSLQCEYMLRLQKSQRPQDVMHEMRTVSPLRMPVTAVPISSTIPTPSCPRMRPSVTVGTSPLRMWRSVPQMVVVVIRTTASVASSIRGFGISSQERRPGP